jgi:hypothetical protein
MARKTFGAGRREPYTATGISRVACVRCGKRARTQFQICADKRLYRPFCTDCDVALNELVMRWIWNDRRETDLDRYREAMYA